MDTPDLESSDAPAAVDDKLGNASNFTDHKNSTRDKMGYKDIVV